MQKKRIVTQFRMLMKGLFLILAALAQEARAGQTPWGEAELREVRSADGSISHCVIDQTYNNKMHVTFALRRDGKMNIGLIVPGAGYRRGGRYPIRLELPSDKFTLSLAAKAGMDDMLFIDLGKSGDEFRDHLTASNSITFVGAMDRMEFSLPQAQAMVQRLEDCVAQQDKTLPPAVLDLLRQSGLGDSEPVDAADIAGGSLFADFAWRRGEIVGGIRQSDSAATMDFEKMVRKQLSTLKKNCKGKWRQQMRKTERWGEARQQRGLLTCARDKNSAVMAILFHRARDGRISIIAHAGDAQQKPVVMAATANIAKVLASGARSHERP